jgi:hypothetical protein
VLVILLIVGIIAVCVYGSNKKKQRAEDIQRHEDDMFVKAHGYDALLAKRREEAKAAQELSAKRGAAVLIGIVVLAVAFAVAGVITGKEPPAPLAPHQPRLPMSPRGRPTARRNCVARGVLEVTSGRLTLTLCPGKSWLC